MRRRSAEWHLTFPAALDFSIIKDEHRVASRNMIFDSLIPASRAARPDGEKKRRSDTPLKSGGSNKKKGGGGGGGEEKRKLHGTCNVCE